eukprot:CAMPEP_0197571000 /NCGR_PEP_ID=MMETSP1320-20131121/41679_1 /TAXON_ID=91990 /ORGANISM="Bolidomonas sp., Strain RCC2347" /LENGTH=331 /DNA_ID=CAMNT_0043133477 /DNA_START=154 /DNA_END=1145 /DNA_ORIENTATION=+
MPKRSLSTHLSAAASTASATTATMNTTNYTSVNPWSLPLAQSPLPDVLPSMLSLQSNDRRVKALRSLVNHFDSGDQFSFVVRYRSSNVGLNSDLTMEDVTKAHLIWSAHSSVLSKQKERIFEMIGDLPSADARRVFTDKTNATTSARTLSTISSNLKEILGITKEKKSVFNDVLAEVSASHRLNPENVDLTVLPSALLMSPSTANLPGGRGSPSQLAYHVLPMLLAREILKNPASLNLDLDALYAEHGRLHVTGKAPASPACPLRDAKSAKLYSNFRYSVDSVKAMEGRLVGQMPPHAILKVERLLKEHSELNDRAKMQFKSAQAKGDKGA